jgi:hypothetical protein
MQAVRLWATASQALAGGLLEVTSFHSSKKGLFNQAQCQFLSHCFQWNIFYYGT